MRQSVSTTAAMMAGACVALTAISSSAIARPNGPSWSSFDDGWADSRRLVRPTARPAVERPSILPVRGGIANQIAAPTGTLHVIVSIDRQRASLYANGALVTQTPVSTGTATHPTPMGVFNVLQKNRHHVSNLYDDAKMPYMQRLTWSGTALHQGALPGYPASHGCVRLPAAFADLLWRTTKRGARVIITRGDVVPVEIAHQALFTNAPEPVPMAGQPPNRRVAAPGAVLAEADRTAIPDADAASAAATASKAATDVATAPAFGQPDRSKGRVSAFISRRDNRLYVRQNGEPLFDTPVTIRNPDRPFGTHVFTAMGPGSGGAMRWTVVSLPSAQPREAVAPAASARNERIEPRRKLAPPPKAVNAVPVPSAAGVLDRIDMPEQASAHVAALLTTGASLIVSDNGISAETGRETDFIILTP